MYFDMERWENPELVIANFYGHTDEPPVVCFDLRCRVKFSGTMILEMPQSAAARRTSKGAHP